MITKFEQELQSNINIKEVDTMYYVQVWKQDELTHEFPCYNQRSAQAIYDNIVDHMTPTQYRGIVKDSTGVINTRRTNWYTTRAEAERSAVLLCNRVMKKTGVIEYETKSVIDNTET